MTKPDDIPQDVLERAARKMLQIARPNGGGDWRDLAPLARVALAELPSAIMAEREACAMIADAILRRDGTMRFVQDAGWSGLRQVLSAAIRNRGH